MATFINPNQDGLASMNVGTGSVLRECLDAYNERCEACGKEDLEIALPDADVVSLNITEATRLVYGLMHGLELLVATNRWLDDQDSEPDTVLTNARWRTNADLPSGAGNWRRATVWPSGGQPTFLTPGAVAAGDIYGPWILQDIQKGIDALRWTWVKKIETLEAQRKSASGILGDTRSEAISNACDEFASMEWEDKGSVSKEWGVMASGTGSQSAILAATSVEGSGYKASFIFGTNKVKITTPSDSIDCAVDLYVKASLFLSSPPFASGGFGWAEDVWQIQQSWGSASRVSETTAMLGTPTVCPFTQVGYTSESSGSTGFDYFQMLASCKWDFSHTL